MWDVPTSGEVTGCRTLGDRADSAARAIDLTLVTGIALRHIDNIGLAGIGSRCEDDGRLDHIDLNHLRPRSVQVTAADAAPHGGRVK
jgi:hypothetical protein